MLTLPDCQNRIPLFILIPHKIIGMISVSILQVVEDSSNKGKILDLSDLVANLPF